MDIPADIPASIDIRRTSGGLSLRVHTPGAPWWTVRLPYPQATELIDAIRTGVPFQAASVALTPEVVSLHCPHTGDSLQVGAEYLGNVLRAHMPDRMVGLP
ncbi:hypothetical protein D5S17_25910 [Pseudonocardiaceae bacterium YIM PH 21723]|nr:hypothetical protein D5S17_25910 [Pseudonocardiaceae bacterium YIM PH 21723]